jgi:hypothetical protein
MNRWTAIRGEKGWELFCRIDKKTGKTLWIAEDGTHCVLHLRLA